MANLKLLYRNEAAGGVQNAAGKTLQLGRERGLVLVLSEGFGEQPHPVAHQLAIATVEQCFKPEILTDKMLQNPLHQLARTCKCVADAFRQYHAARPDIQGLDARTAIVWVKGGQYFVAGDLRLVCFNPVLGMRELPAGSPSASEIYEGDVLLISTSDRYRTMDDVALAETLSAHADNMAECYRAMDSAQATMMIQVISGGKTPVKSQEKPIEKPVENSADNSLDEPVEKDEPLVPIHTKPGHYETHDEALLVAIRGEKYWIVAAALMAIAVIVLFYFF